MERILKAKPEKQRKTCTKCNEGKPISRFRNRYKRKNGKKEYWQNGKCMDCEGKEQSLRYWKNPEKHREYSKQYANKHSKEMSEYNKQYRKDNPDWWENYMKGYRRDNKKRIAELHKIISKKWHQENRDLLSDTYVIHKIISKTNLKRKDVEGNKELIELYRANILLKRKINEQRVKRKIG